MFTYNQRRIKFLLCLWLSLALFLAGCGSKEEVVSGLERTQLVNVLSTLNAAAIPCEKRTNGAGKNESYSVWVDSRDFLTALSTLKNNGLLPEASSEFDQLTKRDGFVPQDRRIEQLREDRLLALDVERLIRNLSGVVEVRATVRSAQSPGENESPPQRSATIVIRFSSKSGVQPFANEELFKIASSIVPGLQPDAITISAARVPPSEESKQKTITVVSDSAASFQSKLWLIAAAALVLVLMIGLMFGFMLREKLIAWKVIPGETPNPMLKTGVNATLSRLPRVKP